MADEGFKRKLAAILCADVEGYSRLMDDDEEATVRTLTSYRNAITDLTQQFRGRVVDSPGDNILAEFSSVVDAVNCAVEIQRDLAERNTELPYHRQMKFRIGVNLGDVIEEDGRIYGDGVNIAARLESMSEAGGICISGRAYDQIANKLGLEYENLGEHQVKNISAPIRIYRVLSFPGAAAHRVVRAKRLVGKKWLNVLLIIVLIVLIGSAAIVWNFYFRLPSVDLGPSRKISSDLPKGPSVAVLPFTNMSGKPNEDYFSDGLTENIIAGLSGCPKLFVIARNSTFTYKGKPVKVQQVAQELGVHYIVEGSVQKADSRIRITAQLIDATTGHHIWAEKYDRELKDIFTLQDEITIKLITAMSVYLTEGEQAQLRFREVGNLQAYMKLLKGLEYFRKQNRKDNALARREVGDAIALDPYYSHAYVLMAATYIADMWWSASSSPLIRFAQATKNVNKAFELDKDNADAHLILGMLYLFKRQHESAIAAAERSIAINPNGADGYCQLAYILFMSGKAEKALLYFKKAFQLNPIPPNYYHVQLGETYFFLKRHAEAIKEFNKAINIEPNDIFAHLNLVSAYAKVGKFEKSRTEISEVYRLDPNFSLDDIDHPHVNEKFAKYYLYTLREAGLN